MFAQNSAWVHNTTVNEDVGGEGDVTPYIVGYGRMPVHPMVRVEAWAPAVATTDELRVAHERTLARATEFVEAFTKMRNQTRAHMRDWYDAAAGARVFAPVDHVMRVVGVAPVQGAPKLTGLSSRAPMRSSTA